MVLGRENIFLAADQLLLTSMALGSSAQTMSVFVVTLLHLPKLLGLAVLDTRRLAELN